MYKKTDVGSYFQPLDSRLAFEFAHPCKKSCGRPWSRLHSSSTNRLSRPFLCISENKTTVYACIATVTASVKGKSLLRTEGLLEKFERSWLQIWVLQRRAGTSPRFLVWAKAQRWRWHRAGSTRFWHRNNISTKKLFCILRKPQITSTLNSVSMDCQLRLSDASYLQRLSSLC